jgi:hypothetical protein
VVGAHGLAVGAAGTALGVEVGDVLVAAQRGVVERRVLERRVVGLFETDALAGRGDLGGGLIIARVIEE